MNPNSSRATVTRAHRYAQHANQTRFMGEDYWTPDDFDAPDLDAAVIRRWTLPRVTHTSFRSHRATRRSPRTTADDEPGEPAQRALAAA